MKQTAGSGSPTAMIEQAAKRLATDPAAAERTAHEALKLAPGDPRAVLILASARRRRGDLEAARTILEPLARAYPNAANTQFELGATLAGLGEIDAAATALRRAVTLNPDLADAWRALGDLLFRSGEAAEAEAAFAEHARACVTDPRLKPAASALFGGRLEEAERLLRAHATAHPRDVLGLHLLAYASLRLGRYAEAEVILAHALAIDPSFDGARFNYATALFHQQKGVQAVAELERLLTRAPADPAYRNLLAAALGLVGEYERANRLHEALVADYPNQSRVWLNHGLARRTVGRGQEAAAAYRRAIALSPGLGEAWWSLANLKTHPITEAETDEIYAQLARETLSAEDRVNFHYALGKALEDRGDWADSFTHYAQGAKLRRATLRHDREHTSARIGRAKTVFTRELFDARGGAGAPSDEPIFILGLPRSGSTLIEQILASHSRVEGTMELPHLGLIAERLDGGEGAYPERAAALDARALRALGEAYLAAAQPHRKLGRPVFIDKMPNNFEHIGLIRLILPNAKVIDARRHPMATGFAVFKQHFAQGQAFSYDLADIGQYYRDYTGLTAHFNAVLPGFVHRVIYEDLVEDPETEIRRLLDACSLPFEPACLAFWETDRAVSTVSSEQVRRPIFRDGLDRWRAYAPWLSPLEAALGPALQTWRETPQTSA